MPLMQLGPPIDPNKPGYDPGMSIPVTGGAPPPMGSTDANQDPDPESINTWLKAQPWYQAAMKAWGLDPNHPKLGIPQRVQIGDAARRAGLKFGGSHDIGPDGDWEEVHTTLAKVVGLAIAGVAGGVGAAGLLAAGAGGATAGADVGALTTVPELGATGAGLTAGGLDAAATTGLTTGAGLPGYAATPTVADLATGGSAIAGQTGGSLAGGSGSTLGRVADALGKGASLAGNAVNGATQAAGQTQLENARLGLTANGQNIQGQSAYEQELMNRAKEEQAQRTDALKNVYRQSYAAAPPTSPYNVAGPPKYSQDYLDALEALKTQGAGKLAKPAQYDTNNIAPLQPYTPYNPNTMSGPGGTQPSTMQTVGNWLGPTLSTIGAIARLYGH